MAPHIQLTAPVDKRDHRQGAPTAAVTLVLYGDYECPYTRQASKVVRALQPHFGEQLQFVFRNFPLIQIHPHALHAAEAAEAAAAQGKFWEMYEYIFHHQHTLEDADLLLFANAVGLNAAKFTQDMDEHRFLPRIEEDVESGIQSGVEGTPTFYLNGVLYQGSWEQDPLQAAITHAIGS
jgi:protein-disulfide isomerase